MTSERKEAFLNSWFGAADGYHWAHGMANQIEQEVSDRFDEAMQAYTRATPSADTLAGLVRYEGYMAGMHEDPNGEYVLYSEAAAVVAALDNRASVAEYKLDQAVNVVQPMIVKRAEAAEDELSQIKELLKDPNAVHIALLRGDIAKPSEQQISHVYAAPISDSLKAENERLKSDLQSHIEGTKQLIDEKLDAEFKAIDLGKENERLREYIAAKASYENATKSESGFGRTKVLKHSDPIVRGLLAAGAAMQEKVEQG